MCMCVGDRYDAGDTIKMVHTMGYSASVLLWGITVRKGVVYSVENILELVVYLFLSRPFLVHSGIIHHVTSSHPCHIR
jgi:hypothetical protein